MKRFLIVLGALGLFVAGLTAGIELQREPASVPTPAVGPLRAQKPVDRYFFSAFGISGVLEVNAAPPGICYSTQSFPARPIKIVTPPSGGTVVVSYAPSVGSYCDRAVSETVTKSILNHPSSYAISWQPRRGGSATSVLKPELPPGSSPASPTSPTSSPAGPAQRYQSAADLAHAISAAGKGCPELSINIGAAAPGVRSDSENCTVEGASVTLNVFSTSKPIRHLNPKQLKGSNVDWVVGPNWFVATDSAIAAQAVQETVGGKPVTG